MAVSCREFLGWDDLDGSLVTTSLTVKAKTFRNVRCFLALYSFCVWCWVWAASENANVWPAYLTNWTFMSITLFFLLSSLMTQRRFARRHPTDKISQPSNVAGSDVPPIVVEEINIVPHEPPSPVATTEARWANLEKVLYIWAELLFVQAWAVVILYWCTEVPARGGVDVDTIASNLHVHFITGIWVTVDLWLSRVSYVKSHLSVCVAYFLIYLTFNGIYAAASNALYSVLKWNSFFSAIVIVGALGLVAGLWWIGGRFARFRFKRTVLPASSL